MHDDDPGPARPLESDPADPALVPDPEPESENDTSFAGLRADISALVEDARTYAEAEIAFQKTRAALAGKRGGRALVLLVLALVLLHIALIALAVGAVIALAPLVTIWGAIGLVVGILLLGVVVLVSRAVNDSKTLAAMFGSGTDA
ncbi:MAG: phage holin family protein [Sphingomonadales bacterium]|nr:MAG: phage holin family protein [Sphingomonadales bacterium]